MHLDLYLDDGTLIGEPDLSITNSRQQFSAGRRRDAAVAHRHCRPSQGYSLVLVRNERLLVELFDIEDLIAGCISAKEIATDYYARRHWPLPSGRVVAAIRPFPQVSLHMLTMCGVDTVFALENLRGSKHPRTQESWINEWLRREPLQLREESQRIFVTYPFKAKAWEK